jgi:hypothetical protein
MQRDGINKGVITLCIGGGHRIACGIGTNNPRING